MKRIFAVILCFVLIFALSATAFADSIMPRNIGFVCTSGTGSNLRRGPGEWYEPIGLILPGEIFWASDTYSGSWHYGYVDDETQIYKEYDEAIEGWVDLTYFSFL